MPLGKTCWRSRSETLNVLRRASTFLVWLQALMATIAQAAPAANHNNDSTPRALSSRLLRTDGAGIEFMGLRLLLEAPPLYERSRSPTSIGHGPFVLVARVRNDRPAEFNRHVTDLQ